MRGPQDSLTERRDCEIPDGHDDIVQPEKKSDELERNPKDLMD